VRYQQALQGGKLVVTNHGTSQELDSARRVLGETSAQNVNSYRAT